MANDIERYLFAKADAQGLPIKGSLELTPLCNLACKMCYIRHTPEETAREGGLRPLSWWLDLVRQLQSAGTLEVCLIGGEIFTFPGLETLYRALTGSGIQVNMTTNGTMLAGGIPAWMTASKPRYVTVSVYGGSPETYRAVTGCADGYERTMRAVDNLLGAGINTQLNYCLIPENAADLDDIMDYAAGRGLKVEATAYNFPPARRECADFARFSPEEAAANELALRRRKDPDGYAEYAAYLAAGRFRQDTPKHTAHFGCRAGRSAFWVNWKGFLTPCGMMETPSADLNAVPFADAWAQIRNTVPRLTVSPDCAVCEKREVCLVCPASIRAETGAFDKRPDYICRFTDALLRLAKDENKKMIPEV